MKNSPNNNSSSIQNKLLLSLKEQNLHEFKQIIESNSNSKSFDVNFFYNELGENSGTLLDIACRSNGNSEFVRILLSNFASVNVINKITGKAPIHEAVGKSDADTLDVLIKKYWYSQCDINLPDQRGATALHLVIKFNKIDFMKVLLKNPNRIDINIGTHQNPTPLHLALLQDNLEAANLLLKFSHIDLDFQQDAQGRTCRQIIQQQYQQQFGQRLGTIRSTCNIGSILFSLLKRHEIQLFKNLANQVDVRFLNDNHNGCQTYLQCACDLGLISIVDMLLSKGVNPNRTVKKESLTPAMIAAHNGFDGVLKSLITNPNIRLQIVELGSVLHSVIEGMFNVTACQREGHRKCLQLILNEATPHGGLDLNFEDHDGFTSLFQAMMLNDDQVIKSLIYAGARFYQINYRGEIYLMINSSSLSGYLDSCISSRNESPFVIDPEIIIDYKTLIQSSENLSRRVVYEMEIFTILENVPELRKLLKHPVLVSFLYMKWHLVKKYYFINFAMYLSFCLSLSLYIFYIYHDSSFPLSSPSHWNSEESCLKIFLSKLINNDRMKRYINDAIANSTTSEFFDNYQHPFSSPLTSPIFLWWCMTQIFYGILVLRELFQFFVSPRFYLKSPENRLEMTVIFISGALLYHPRPDQLSPFTAVVILASWIELVFLLGRHPLFATEIQMFKTVMWNFLKFMTLYSSMILAFAFSFYILMKPDPDDDSGNQSDFRDPAMSIFKSIIMLTGEFNLESIPLGSPVLNFNHLVFILFVFFISIVLYNLLNGLAISDTQAIREDAELVGIVSQIKLISYLELLSNRNPFHYIRSLSWCCCGSLKTWLIRIELNWLSFYRRMYRDKISLWPKFVAGTHIRILSHRKNTVLFPDFYDWKKGTYRYSKRYNWEIHPSIVKRAKEILEKRNESNETDHCHQELQSINHYQSKFEAIEKNIQLITNEVLNLKSEVVLCQKNVLSKQEILQGVVTEIHDLKNKIDQLRTQPVY